VHVYDCDECQSINSELANAILALPDAAYTQRSHFFHGRYENLYLDVERVPGLKIILDTCLEQASLLLEQAVEKLKLGFWLNIMRAGDVTTLHTHDDDDELLSAVYYVQVPDQSGVFKLHRPDGVQEIKPVAGRFMFFDPALPHEVTQHNNTVPRISLGINIGPANIS